MSASTPLFPLPRRARLLAATAALALTAACTLGPDYQPPAADAPASWSATATQATAQVADKTQVNTDPTMLAHWWTEFRDPTLDKLVADVVAGNLDLKVAEQRILSARAQRQQAAAAQYPSVKGESAAMRNRLPPGATGSLGGTSNIFLAGFDASWELDLFGGTRRSIEAADANIEAGIENRRSLVMSMLAELGTDYAALRSVQARIVIANENVRLSQETRDLTAAKYKVGLATELQLAEADGQLEQQKAVLPSLATQAAQRAHAIATLTGRTPADVDSLLTTAGPEVPLPPTLPANLPSEVVRARPDIRAAERTMAATNAQIGVKEAARFPKLSLGLIGGFLNPDIGKLLQGDSFGWSVGPTLSGPIYDGGRLKAGVKDAEAQAEEARLTYRKTVLTAFQEVEDALVAYANERQRNETLHRALDAAQRAQDRARSQYRAGLADFLTVLDADRTLATSKDAVAQSDYALVQQTIALYKALGGGWQAGETTAVAGAAGTPPA
ncbi:MULTISPECIES: efflux transporter outer membrane subunit [Nitrospirillum]|uniref:NodT family efflux transporter outer membrane factor (OMF) lipoprotein n=1 Tax=Nitrospirillum amazonense TaxID=28077 RepID=A0A560FUJ0_9PROT|nr:efflux transporter outer membrane subunit [Nitrospirillum amazonense]MEC4592637.1 efflux transporter outer membrane subunit [Nitrospirillum amazonense]TWB25306.1 NodT family efflux transporter outer membrane factor (OMF) lipoprotein [Nitrospirillum amazonense]